MSSEAAIQVEALGKCYQLYDQPRDRLKQFVLPRLRSLLGLPIRQHYREFWALKDVSIEIRKGETVGIIGRNGSGKSTLLQMICGTLNPTRGCIRSSGRIAALLELGSGFNPEFTGRENVYMNASVLGLAREEIDARFDDILAFSEIGDFIEQPVRKYSSGMYSRLAFSIAINVDPEILIVDEALAVGDARFVAKCMRRIKDIQARGASILFVSHDVGTVRTLCERAVWLDGGRLVEQGDVLPVTGRFMEFMFKDENVEQDAAHEGIAASISMEPLQAPASTGEARPAPLAAATEAGFFPDQAPSGSPPVRHAEAVTHWGGRKGMIRSAAILDEQGGRQDVYAWGRVLQIRIEVDAPRDMSREHLGVSFSIKDLKGTDLIVATTHDFDGMQLPDRERFCVSFRFENFLVTGKYLLVVAVENRKHADIRYHEYIEGVQYFSSLANERLHGIFRPEIVQNVIS